MTQRTNTTVAQLVRTPAGRDVFAVLNSSNLTLFLVKYLFSPISFVIYRELGRQERESLQKIAAITKEGFLLKQQLIQEAKRGVEDKKVRLSRETQKFLPLNSELWHTGCCCVINVIHRDMKIEMLVMWLSPLKKF